MTQYDYQIHHFLPVQLCILPVQMTGGLVSGWAYVLTATVSLPPSHWVVFLDLTAAYDTVWHKGLLVKLSKVLPCWAVSVIELLLGQRRFRVHMGDISSSWRMQNNGLPQWAVLAPTLFNLYINDLPATACRKLIYADDICLAHQARKFEDLTTTTNTGIANISELCKRWRLQPSVAKTESSTFHLHNARN